MRKTRRRRGRREDSFSATSAPLRFKSLPPLHKLSCKVPHRARERPLLALRNTFRRCVDPTLDHEGIRLPVHARIVKSLLHDRDVQRAVIGQAAAGERRVAGSPVDELERALFLPAPPPGLTQVLPPALS